MEQLLDQAGELLHAQGSVQSQQQALLFLDCFTHRTDFGHQIHLEGILLIVVQRKHEALVTMSRNDVTAVYGHVSAILAASGACMCKATADVKRG